VEVVLDGLSLPIFFPPFPSSGLSTIPPEPPPPTSAAPVSFYVGSAYVFVTPPWTYVPVVFSGLSLLGEYGLFTCPVRMVSRSVFFRRTAFCSIERPMRKANPRLSPPFFCIHLATSRPSALPILPFGHYWPHFSLSIISRNCRFLVSSWFHWDVFYFACCAGPQRCFMPTNLSFLGMTPRLPLVFLLVFPSVLVCGGVFFA